MKKRVNRAYFSLIGMVAAGLVSAVIADPAASRDGPVADLVLPIVIENHRIRVTVDWDNRPLSMLLDSGASTTILFSDNNGLADQSPITGSRQVLFPALDETIPAHSLAPIEFGFGPQKVILRDLVLLEEKHDLKARLLLRYDGILGREFFSKFTIQLDPESATLSLYEIGTDLSALYQSELDLFLKDDGPHIRFRNKMPWEDKPSMKEMLIDTGYPGALVFWDIAHYRQAAKRATPVGRWGKTAIVGRANFKFGKSRFAQTPVYLSPTPPRQATKRHGIIGATLLNHGGYAIDLSNKRLWLLAKRLNEAGFIRQIDGTFYPPNNNPFLQADFKGERSIAMKTVIRNE